MKILAQFADHKYLNEKLKMNKNLDPGLQEKSFTISLIF